MGETALLLSVIIPTRNRADQLAQTLAGIADVDFPANSFEVIVVDTAGTDATPDVCRGDAARSFAHFRYERCDKPGLHIGRHRGAKLAAGDILVYGDDDITPFPSWLSAIADAFADPDVALVGGRSLPRFETPPPAWVETLWESRPWGRVLWQYSIIDFGETAQHIPTDYVWGCNYAIRKSVLFESGGFHPDAMPAALLRFRGDGETGLSQAVAARGLEALYHPDASVHHRIPAERLTLEHLHRRGVLQGISDSFAITRASGRPAWFRDVMRGLRMRCRRLAEDVGGRLRATLTGNLDRWRARRAWQWGLIRGFCFHSAAVRSDPDLLSWILRPDYWDEDASPALPVADAAPASTGKTP